MTGLRYSPLHVTEFCGEMQGKFKVGLARLIRELKADFQSVLRTLESLFTTFVLVHVRRHKM